MLGGAHGGSGHIIINQVIMHDSRVGGGSGVARIRCMSTGKTTEMASTVSLSRKFIWQSLIATYAAHEHGTHYVRSTSLRYSSSLELTNRRRLEIRRILMLLVKSIALLETPLLSPEFTQPPESEFL